MSKPASYTCKNYLITSFTHKKTAPLFQCQQQKFIRTANISMYLIEWLVFENRFSLVKQQSMCTMPGSDESTASLTPQRSRSPPHSVLFHEVRTGLRPVEDGSAFIGGELRF
ncbi:hypothetical protein PHYBLDRAFT_183760 [Phycomyces blakesleeanus NRRL 1555(-)]|uniref:Uncharacterized protein n=1 Tax=Phycomyces blakesleeanus (strain ATCC 8743b / DSM 1359 / FGSC 10004 / NBRC 33097 / NRRL 1555) TaxID=763407 RepID=A0A162ZHX6_PHYB8|nr:hypothetical protein PHYBLDRAFT_183760 [Phycomyces blakesleeanus NRRL 1555(-)]OAD66891.1 hypothetical protein PHYBLDRAFT_183760 [Phycomyces blakesleeanus NRRL 1555(-)]|eukprot:XP_018284931.1 hypothetical protein PHYBLDRAFT_183760 [Phycomyces blakesleeanus NRRL 1555(-)]